jgi:flagellar basal-body rod modification protein FlgD
MTVSTGPVVPTATSLYTTGTSAAAPKQQMDQEVFLALLVAQLRNQDPTSPMDTTEMMAQSTQLASMEQLTAVADTTRESFALQMRVAASALLGQQVSFMDADGVVHTGVVDGVDFSAAVPVVTVGEWRVPLDAVSTVRSSGSTDGPVTDPTDGTTGADSAPTTPATA